MKLPILRAIAFALTLLVVPAARAQPAPGWVGAYIWGGLITTQHSASEGAAQFHDSVRFMLAQGFDTIRFTIGPKAMAAYNLPSSRYCRGADRKLGCFARLMLASDAWDDPGLRRVMLSLADFACYTYASDNNGCLYEPYLKANEAAIAAEYTDLLQVLHDRFAGRGIQIIISNWEGDNFVYCGSYRFARRAPSAAKCMAKWPAGQTTTQRADAFLYWYSIKDAAVSAFRANHPDFDVIVAPEFNGWYDTFDRGCNGRCDPGDELVSRIEAAGGREYCSYSSYGSQGQFYIEKLSKILERSCKNLIIGEFGRDYPRHSRADIEANFALVDKARRLVLADGRRVIGVVPWHAIDGETLPKAGPHEQVYGLFRYDGREVLHPLMGGLRPTPPEPKAQK